MKLMIVTSSIDNEQFAIPVDNIEKVYKKEEGKGSVIEMASDTLFVEESVEDIVAKCNKK